MEVAAVGARRTGGHASVVRARGRRSGVGFGGGGRDGCADHDADRDCTGGRAVVATRGRIVGHRRRRVVVGRWRRRTRVGVGSVIRSGGRVVVGAPLGMVGRAAVCAGGRRALAIGVGGAPAVSIRRRRLPRPFCVGHRPSVGSGRRRPLAGGVRGAAAVGSARGGRALAVGGRPSVPIGVRVGGGARRSGERSKEQQQAPREARHRRSSILCTPVDGTGVGRSNGMGFAFRAAAESVNVEAGSFGSTRHPESSISWRRLPPSIR